MKTLSVLAAFVVLLFVVSSGLTQTSEQNTGYRAVSVFPTMKEGHPVADVTLVKGNE